MPKPLLGQALQRRDQRMRRNQSRCPNPDERLLLPIDHAGMAAALLLITRRRRDQLRSRELS